MKQNLYIHYLTYTSLSSFVQLIVMPSEWYYCVNFNCGKALAPRKGWQNTHTYTGCTTLWCSMVFAQGRDKGALDVRQLSQKSA